MHPHQKPKKNRPPKLLIIGGAVVILVAVVIAIAQGSGNNSNSSAAPAPSASTQASASPSDAPSSAQAESSPCTSHHCITEDAEQGLPGAVAKDNSVITKAGCYESTVKSDGSGDYTVDCAATYSDRDVVDGYATVELAKNYVLFEPSENGDSGQ